MPAEDHAPLSSRVWHALALLLVLAGVVSAVAGVAHATHRSQDFQWSGERLLLHHVDPWLDYLQGDPAHGLLATQVPNYLPVLYMLLVPFGLISAFWTNLAWAVCNVLFAVGSAVLAARFFGFRRPLQMLLLAAALLASSPARVTTGNGQQGLLVLLLWCAGLLTLQALTLGRAVLVGISYLKYSFAPPLALYLLLRDGWRRSWRLLLWTLVPSAISTGLVWLWITGGRDVHHLFALVAEPLAVTRVGYQPTGDPAQTFMDLFEFMIGGGPVGTPRLTLISLLVAVAMTLMLMVPALRYARSMPDPIDRVGWPLALMAAISFVLYKHHPYDEVVFLFAACYALRHHRRPAAVATLFLIGYCWYVQPSVDLRVHFSFAWCWARICILFSLLLCLYRIPFDRRTFSLQR